MKTDGFILFIDSGMGGLSILNYFLKFKNNCNIIFYADTKNFPYGKKEENVVGNILYNIVKMIEKKYKINLIVIVCNTASVSALNFLRKKISIPIIGTVPAVKPASKITSNNKIGIIATETTVKSGYIDDLVNKFAQNKEVYIKSSNILVSIVENDYNDNQINKIIEEELSFFKEKQIDVLVLGCTHYSFLKEKINSYFNNNVVILDSIEGVTKRIIQLLPDEVVSVNPKSILYISSENNKEKYIDFNNKYQFFKNIIVEDKPCLKA